MIDIVLLIRKFRRHIRVGAKGSYILLSVNGHVADRAAAPLFLLNSYITPKIVPERRLK